MALVTAYSSRTGRKADVPEAWVGKTFGTTKWLKSPPKKTDESEGSTPKRATKRTAATAKSKKGGE